MKNEMKAKMARVQKKAISEFDNDTDLLITTFKDGQCCSVIHGSVQNIAQSLFALMHDQNNKMGVDIYRIIKLIVLNTINNESPYAADLLTSIINTTEVIENEDTKSDNKAMLIKMNNNEQN